MTYTITPRPQHRDVLMQADDRPTLLICMRSEPLDMDALEAEARRIAALLDGRAEAVIEAARRWLEWRDDPDTDGEDPGGVEFALVDALAALDGEP